MKKALSLCLAAFLLLALVPSLASCSKALVDVENLEGTYTRDLAGTTLNVYNWAEYISEGAEGTLYVTKAFEKLTGIEVNYSTYESNEVMYSKLKSDAVSYDVIIPSDYMIERLISEGMLLSFDPEKELSNYSYIDGQYKNLYFDPDNTYSVPYNVGMVGLIYNTKMVTEAPDSWSALWDEAYKGKILMFNNSRDSFGIAQALVGVDLNSTDKADWDKAAAKLEEQKPLLQGYVMDEVFNKMEDGNAALAPYYAGDFLTMQEINPDLAFVYPKEGVNIFVDSMCIPANARNAAAAKLFINFMLEPEVALANAETICYASPNTGVTGNPEYSLADNEYLYPKDLSAIKTTYFRDLDPSTRKYYEDLWVRITTGN